eukprot:3560729-Prymnesium_polylepis.1
MDTCGRPRPTQLTRSPPRPSSRRNPCTPTCTPRGGLPCISPVPSCPLPHRVRAPFDRPPSVFPRLTPVGLPCGVPNFALRHVPLRNLPNDAPADRRRRVREGNRRQYELKLSEELARLGGGCADDGDDGCAPPQLSPLSPRSTDLSPPEHLRAP